MASFQDNLNKSAQYQNVEPVLDSLHQKTMEMVMVRLKTCNVQLSSPPPTCQYSVFTGRMPFLSPIQQCRCTEDNTTWSAIIRFGMMCYSGGGMFIGLNWLPHIRVDSYHRSMQQQCILWTCTCMSASFSEQYFWTGWSLTHVYWCSVAEWLGRRTCEQQVAGSNPGLTAVECNPGQVVNTRASVIKQYNLVPASGLWCLVAGKVTIGLALHWPRVTDIGGYPFMGLKPGRGRWAPTYTFLVEYGKLCAQ